MHRLGQLVVVVDVVLVLLGGASIGDAGPDRLNGAPPLPHKSMMIVGGAAADIKDFGHQISWFSGGYHRCGGSIISPDWVLTAAHCCIGVSASSSQQIIAGTSLITAKGKEKGQVTQITEIITHSHFNVSVYANDLALLKVSPAFTFDAVVHAISIIDTSGSPLPGEPVTVTGWGLLKENSNYQTPILQKVKVFVNETVKCKAKYREVAWPLPETLMCAAAEKKDACQGDSGGPLIYKLPEDGGHRLVGVVSSGIGCANKEYPGLYTDLRNREMRSFISETTGLRLA